MDVTALRNTLAGPLVGKQVKYQERWYDHVTTYRSYSLGGLVRATKTFFPLTVSTDANSLTLGVTDIASFVPDPGIGIYIPDKEKQATFWEVDNRHNIVVSGKFSGCDFVVVFGQGRMAMAHVYRKASDQGVPVASQISAVQQLIGGPPRFGSRAKSYATPGKAAIYGLVIATRVAHWEYHWVSVGGENRVAEVKKLTDEDWVYT